MTRRRARDPSAPNPYHARVHLPPQRRALACLGLALTACRPPDAVPDDTSTTAPGTTTTTTTTTTPTTGTTDQLPPAPTLQSPADGATDLPLATTLCWNLVDDPDGDPLRYRIYIDDTVLTEGTLGDQEGYEGPCVGPLFFAFERTYTWQVEAFEVADPARTGPRSPTWSFTTIDDGVSKTVFQDNFDDDLGWQVGGDASQGAWLRGAPFPAFDVGMQPSQPAACLGGLSCYFTGQNPDGLPTTEDVAGGSTTLTSPPFDLGGAATATVQLGRFFYKTAAASGPALQVELLVPDPDSPGEFTSTPLELLDQPTTDLAANLWIPREYAACGAPMRDGSRLRITASDTGSGVLEAAIDNVSVHAHDDDTVCGDAVGGHCQPDADSCSGELLCCNQGVTNDGVYRCTTPVPGLLLADPTPTPESPGNGPPGCDAPDLVVDGSLIEPAFTDIQVFPTTCELFEGCVDALGVRTIMRFSVGTPNIGAVDLVMGIPANHPELYHYSECHDHYHFDEFARYELRAGDEVITRGHKQAFCMLDTISWAWPLALPRFDCANQGISRGFSDVYESDLPCQWIDVTDVPPGDYELHISLNNPRPGTLLPVLNERDYSNNTLTVPVTIP